MGETEIFIEGEVDIEKKREHMRSVESEREGERDRKEECRGGAT